MKRSFLLFAIAGLFAVKANAQTGIGTTSPAASAQLDVTSTTKGFLAPRMLSSQRTAISSPAEGLLVFQTDAPIGYYIYANGSWTKLTTAADAGSTTIPACYTANTSGSSIAVVLGGTDVPMANAQNIGTGFSINGSNTVITIANAGKYQFTYRIGTTANLLASTRLVVNGSTLSGSLVSPSVSINQYFNTAIANISAGSTVELQMFGLIATAVLAGDASLSIVRLQ